MPASAPGNPRLVGVYAANGGLFGELSYVVGKLRGARSCGLCDISHGTSVRAKPAWSRGFETLDVPFTAVHLNEMDEETALAAASRSPVVVLLEDRRGKILLDESDLAGCRGDPGGVRSHRSSRIAGHL